MEHSMCNWKTDLSEIKRWADTVKRAEVSVMAHSAGNRPIWKFTYGKKSENKSYANYNSACGAHDESVYLNRKEKIPVVLLVGAIHGLETEGTAALLNLLSLLKTGYELSGKENQKMLQAVEGVRLILVPVRNPDGRDRVVPQSMIGLEKKKVQYWGQGTWTDGTLCKCSNCKKVHPILGFWEVILMTMA